ncbi:MAG: LAGLIDADG family homing endonuclease [Deltaproteobacteria bacterium]|nr:LAGLIDADG family homing endonuclease [Deltaproteobacteria bacterium]
MEDETIDNQQATDLEIGWLAGIIDGEGYIGFSRQNSKKVRSIRPDIQVVNCDPDVILKIRKILNIMGINPYIRERMHDKKKFSSNYILQMSRFSHVKKLIDTIGHLLTGEKQKRAKLMIELVNSRIIKTKRDRYTDYELSLVDTYFDKMKGVKIRGNTHNIGSLNDYQTEDRALALSKV